jgi:protein-S-isoprenylcysteine O-methyltransferase Ste14
MKSLELRVPPVLQVAILGIVMYGVANLFSAFQFLVPGLTWLGVSLGIMGMIVASLGIAEFRKAQTTVDPRAPEDSASLVICGVYQYSRNPMYLGFFFLLLGWALYLSHVFVFALLPLFIGYMNRFQIQPEEKFMLQKFGDAYRLYITQVRRWV